MRNSGVAGLFVLVVLTCLGISAALVESSFWVLVIVFCAILWSVTVILLAIRYQLRLMRTQERKALRSEQRLSEKVEKLQDTVERSTADISELHRINAIDGATRLEALERAVDASSSQFRAEIAGVDKAVKDSARVSNENMVKTVRHSTNEIEALIQIFSEFTDAEFPMPSTGGWAIDAQALGYIISLVKKREPQRILELGSGTSTIWLGYLCRPHGGKVIAIDHLEGYLEQTRNAVSLHELYDRVECRLAPLEQIYCDKDSYQWYSADAFRELSDIDMVIVDGPPAGTGKKARYPALPRIISHLAPNVTVILDDAHRKDEKEIVDSWLSQNPDFTLLNVGVPGLAVLQRGYERKEKVYRNSGN